MIEVRVIEKPAFRVVGQKTWINGLDDGESFGRFWDQCKQDGLFETFQRIRGIDSPGPITNGMYLGVSRVEKDPSDRRFFFYVCIESDETNVYGLEEIQLPAGKWAVFQTIGPMPDALIAAEMYCFETWLPNSGYEHAKVPELEVYPPYPSTGRDTLVEYWMPVVDRVFGPATYPRSSEDK